MRSCPEAANHSRYLAWDMQVGQTQWDMQVGQTQWDMQVGWAGQWDMHYASGECVFSFEGPGLDCQMGMLFHPLILNYVFHLKLVDPD